jgi:hypothetical protein
MSFSIRIHSVQCLEESDEISSADEPYVLVTTCSMLPPAPGQPRARTLRYGEWEHFDQGEILDLIGERPFWGMRAEPWEPEDIGNPDDVCFVVTVMEHDSGSIDGYRGQVEAAANTTLLSNFTLTRPARVVQLVDAVKSALAATAVPTFDNHVATKEFRLDGSDLMIPSGTSKDKHVAFDGGDEGKWELVFRIVHHERNVVAPNARLAAVSRASDLMEIWSVDNSGTLRGNWFLGRWHGWYALAGRKFPAGANLVAVTRNSDHMEVWGVGEDGQVHGIWFDGSKWRDWYTLPGASFPPGAPLAAVSRHPDLMEVWGIDVTGQVRGTFFDNGWQPPGNWYTLGGVTFRPQTHLVAASRNANHMQIWVVTDDQPLQSNRFDGTQWLGWDKLDGESFSPATRLAAVVRKDKFNMHVLAIDLNQHVRDFWHEGDTKRGWFQAGTEFFAPGTALAAVSRQPQVFEAWSITSDGAKRGNPHPSNWGGWYPLGGDPNPLGGDVAAVTMHSDHMEVWMVGNDGVMGNSFRDNAWQGWYPLRWSFVA